MSKPIRVASVWLSRAEGKTVECERNRSRFFSSFVAANRELASWARSAPEGGGYDKCDFVVTYEDGETYEGRFDLTRDHRYGASLEKQMNDFLRFYAGRYCPPHMTHEKYATFLAQEGREERRAACEALLESYELGEAVGT